MTRLRRFPARLAVLLAPAVAATSLGVGVAGGETAPTVDPAADESRAAVAAPIVIGHRGASGYRPEHTLAAYELAIGMGADFIEPDLVATKDHVLVARHEPEISGTTDVADHPEFADRRTTKVLDGQPVEGWFTEDFTLAELKTLRAVERIPDVRPVNTAFDGRYEIPTLQEVIDLAERFGVGVYPETKHPTYFADLGLGLAEPLLATLEANGLTSEHDPVIVQSFEPGILRDLAERTDVRLVQLLGGADARPHDLEAAGDPRTYGDLMTPEGLADIATYADGIGPWKDSIVPRDADGHLLAPTSLVADAHAEGLVVHPYTFRRENAFLAAEHRRGDPEHPRFAEAIGDFPAELRLFFDLGVDGVFTDNPDVAVAVRTEVLADEGAGHERPSQHSRLLGRSVLPALTFRAGSEPSGHFATGANGVDAPYPGQPVQGFSAVHANGDGTYLVMSDNGFGNKQNSPDFLLWVHTIAPGTTTGVTEVVGDGFGLHDPDGHIPWPIWRDGGCAAAAAVEPLPDGYACPEPDRQLTGWDFDLESMQVAPDGTLWFGEEFGPYLLHTDATGRLLGAPVPTPGVASPSNPTLAPGQEPNLGSSKGFEGMAISPDGDVLYPMLEGALAEDVAAGLPADLRILRVEIDGDEPVYDDRYWRYRLEHPGNAIGDLVAIDEHRFIAIERDSGSGPTARFKALFEIDLRDHDGDGYVDKRLLVNLMAIPDPDGVGGTDEAFFAFPFVTIEDVAILDDHTLAVLNDNNFPGGGGRAEGVPDANELILIHLDQPLGAAPTP